MVGQRELEKVGGGVISYDGAASMENNIDWDVVM